MSLKKRLIKRRIGDLSKKIPIIVYKTIDSTNTQAKLAAESGKYESAVFIAGEQTAGRGRLGRNFISESGKGLYLSILISGSFAPDFAVSLTTYMAVVASRAIEKLTDTEPKIKWVNDIYLGGKKAAGILTEGKAKCEGTLAYAVVGIGINLLKQEFPEDVKAIATTIEDECGKAVDVNELASLIVKEFFGNLHLVGTTELADEYRAHSFLIGERVNVIKPTTTYEASVRGITDKCELILELPDGEVEILSTGEVSVRPSGTHKK